MASSIKESDGLVENACCVCVKKGRMTEADFYCVNCVNYYCTACLDVHGIIPATNGHKMLGKSDFKSTFGSILGSLPTFPTKRCALHPSKVLDIYCGDHDEVVCATCVLEHRTCRRVKSVPENIYILYPRPKVKDTKQSLTFLKAKLLEQQRIKNQQTVDLKKSIDRAVAEVHEFRKKLQNLIEDAELQTFSQLEKEYNYIETFIIAEINELKSLTDSVDQMVVEVEKTDGNKAQEFVYVKICEKLSAKVKKRSLDKICSFHQIQSPLLHTKAYMQTYSS